LKFGYLLAFLIVWLSIATLASFYTTLSTERIVIVFFLLIAVCVLISQLASRSVRFDFFPRTKNRLLGPSARSTSKISFLVENASKGRAYGRREIAKILRESLLTREFGQEGFPLDWIASANGDDAVNKILRSKDCTELTPVFVLPERSIGAKPLTSSNDRNYLYNLARAISLIEDKR
jgi:hypothetical protein